MGTYPFKRSEQLRDVHEAYMSGLGGIQKAPDAFGGFPMRVTDAHGGTATLRPTGEPCKLMNDRGGVASMVEEQVPSHGGNAHLAGTGIGRGVVGGEAVHEKQVPAFDGIQRLIHFAGHLRVS